MISWTQIVESLAKIETKRRLQRRRRRSFGGKGAMSENEQVSIDSSSIVCAEALIEGEVTMKEGCVVHPHVTIDASKGPIFIGQNNVFEEFTVIRNNSDGQPMIIGDSNVFEVRSQCSAKYVGSRNVIGVHAVLENGCSVSDDCSVTPRARVLSHQNLEPFVVVLGEHGEHRKTVAPNLNPVNQLEILRKILPSYHHLYGAKKKKAAAQ